MSLKYLDYTGLSVFLGKVKTIIPTNNNQLTNGAGYQTQSDVNTLIDAKIASAYKAKGSCTFANKPALSSSHNGEVWNITDSFTTTSDFVEGAGNNYPAGTNIVVVNAGTDLDPVWKYDVLAGFVDLSGYYTSLQTDTLLGGKQDTLTAGTNISISSNVISTSAEVNVIDTIKVNGTSQTVTNKAVDISVPVLDAITTQEINALFE